MTVKIGVSISLNKGTLGRPLKYQIHAATKINKLTLINQVIATMIFEGRLSEAKYPFLELLNL